uniref:Uncharacterized protein n=1 Tax=Anopheles culicifacies TaxID=139723 RepID=A0A182M6Y9_9DIPT
MLQLIINALPTTPAKRIPVFVAKTNRPIPLRPSDNFIPSLSPLVEEPHDDGAAKAQQDADHVRRPQGRCAAAAGRQRTPGNRDRLFVRNPRSVRRAFVRHVPNDANGIQHRHHVDRLDCSDVTYLPAHIFGTDDISVQMAVFVVIIGTINYASLFVMNIVGRSARQSYIIALEEIFLAAFGLFLTILGVVVLLLVQAMNLANRVLSVTILVSHTFLGVLYLLAKVKQMRQLADRMHATNAPPRTETNHMRSLRRLGERSHDLESSRYPYRVVNPGANIGNDIAIPPNMRLLSSSFGTTPRVPSYADPFGALQTSQSTVSTTTDEVDPLLGPAPSVNVPCVLDIGNKPNPTVQQSPSKESSPEPSMSPIRALHGKPFRVNPTTFRHTTEVDIEPMPSSMDKLKPT